jgi:hypothetical protein
VNLLLPLVALMLVVGVGVAAAVTVAATGIARRSCRVCDERPMVGDAGLCGPCRDRLPAAPRDLRGEVTP